MEISRPILKKYIREIVIDQLKTEYLASGYNVVTNLRVGKYQPDLVLQKDNRCLVFEIKEEGLSKEGEERLRELSRFVRSHANYEFKIVIANPPRDKEIEIESIEDLLHEQLMEDLPSDLDMLSTHTYIDEVSDVEVDEVFVSSTGEISVKGVGTVSVTLQYGSESDMENDIGSSSGDSFPLSFSVTLTTNGDHTLKIDEIEYIQVDTSSFHE